MKPALIIFLLCSFFSGCVKSCSEPLPVLRIGTNVWPGYEPLYYAREIGLLSKEHFSMVEFGSATENIRSFRSNLVDFSALTLDETMLLAHDGVDAKILFVMDVSNGADVVIGPSSAKSISDLIGKRIGFEDTALGGYMLNRALSHAGVKREQIQPVYMEVDQHEQSYKEGKVDALVTFEPVKSKLLAEGNQVLFSSKDIPGEIVDVLVVRKEIYQKYPERCQEIIKVWYATLAEIERNRDAAEAFMAQREHITSQDFRAAMNDLIVPNAEDNAAYIAGEKPKLLESIAKISEFMKASGRFTKVFDPNDILVKK